MTLRSPRIEKTLSGKNDCAPPGATLTILGRAELPGIQIFRMDDHVMSFYSYLDFYGILLPLKTNARVRYRRVDYEARPYDLFLTEPGELFSTDCRQIPERNRSLYVSVEAMDRLRLELGYGSTPLLFRSPVTRDKAVLRRLVLLHQALEENATPLEVESRFLTCMRLMLHRTSAGSPAVPRVRSENAAVRRACDLLRSRLAENVTLDELARDAGLPRLQFFRAFAAKVGLPPHEYQLQLRVAEARRRLSWHEPVVEVATDLGFYDQAHFTRHFRRIVGLPPRTYSRSFPRTVSGPSEGGA